MKKILLFHMGYAELTKQNFGSEIALLNLAKELSGVFDVYIASSNCENKTTIEGIPFITNRDVEKLTVDILIISRYINIFIDITVKAKKVYLWLHDTIFQPFWRGISLTDNGKHLYKNVESKIDKIIVLSEYHKQLITNTYEISSDKIVVIGYGLSPQSQSNIYKIKKRFIWTSDPVRNLDFLLKIFPKIRSEFADAELHIFRDNLSEDQKHIVENHSQFIKHRGFLTNDKIQEEFQKSDVWLYCTDFTETFCLSALEAMRAGCLCIVSEIGNLPDIVAERGIILSKLEEEEIIKILRIHFDIDLFKNLIKKGQSWAELHTWEKIGKVWLELIGNDAFIL